MLKKYLARFFWVPVLHKQYQNTSGFTTAVGVNGQKMAQNEN